MFQLHRFLNPFLKLAPEKKDSKDDAARIFFGSSYFVTALATYTPNQHTVPSRPTNFASSS